MENVIDLTRFDVPFTLVFGDVKLVNDGNGFMQVRAGGYVDTSTINAILRPDIAASLVVRFAKLVKVAAQTP